MISTSSFTFIMLIIALFIALFIGIIIIFKGPSSQLKTSFLFLLSCVQICLIGFIFQVLLSDKLGIDPFNFEHLIYIGNVFFPIALLFFARVFANTKIKFKKTDFFLIILSFLFLISIWTNKYHHLFYLVYDIYPKNTQYGPLILYYVIYTYSILFFSLFYLLRFSLKTSGVFSKQSILIILGCLCPIIVNLLGYLKIFDMTIYVTNISFSFSLLLFAFAILKFDFLKVAPIALQKIVDRISDGYLVLNDTYTIIDFNQTFLTTFKVKDKNIRGKNIEAFLKKTGLYLGFKDLKPSLEKVKNNDKTISYEQTINKIHKTFTIEINTISSDGASLGTLLLFKDITQHKEDMETIKNNQNILMERERLASLGQLIGGIAHNLKTPIMSIAGAAEGLNDLTKELDASIGNEMVTEEDFHAIAQDMDEWIVKIKSYAEYMSDIISAVKGQAVILSNEEAMDFTVVELFKRIDILMRHELKKAVVYLNSTVNVSENTSIKGDINSLVQVINNMISNAIQSYNGEPEKSIDLTAKLDGKYVIISVKDYGPGLPDKVKDKLFKEMITTKGKNGTGLGLYMSYSTIKAHFGGDITVETEAGKGTTFNVILPVAK